MQHPIQSYWQVVKRILRYLIGSLDSGMIFQPSSSSAITLEGGFCDADWPSDPNDRRSTSGYCVFFGLNLISWQSKKQSLVSRSSTEAEYRSLVLLVTEITWIFSLLAELHFPLSKPPVALEK